MIIMEHHDRRGAGQTTTEKGYEADDDDDMERVRREGGCCYCSSSSSASRVLHNKRKLVDTRRKYEAQHHKRQQQEQRLEQQQKHTSGQDLLEPGRPLALDRVLLLSNHIPKIVVQATPPFLVVHTNASFLHLIDSGAGAGMEDSKGNVVGKPVSVLLSMNEDDFFCQQVDGWSVLQDGSVMAAGNEKDLSLDRIIAMGDFRHVHLVDVQSLYTSRSRSSQHDSLGSNVVVAAASITQDAGGSFNDDVVRRRRRAQDDSDENTISTSSRRCDGDFPLPPITCHIAIAPVVASESVIGNSCAVFHGKQHQAQRQGDAFSLAGSTRPTVRSRTSQQQPSQQHATHFVMQLQPRAAIGDNITESLSSSDNDDSTSSCVVEEAHLIGATKGKGLQRYSAVPGAALPQEDDDDDDDNNTSSDVDAAADAQGAAMSLSLKREPLTAIG